MIDGIYTAYMSGAAGQGLGMFVFNAGAIAGADVAGITFAGSYDVRDDRAVGMVEYVMPAASLSITGASFEQASGPIRVPIDLPIEIDPRTTYRINTPIGPLNVKFVKNVSLGAEHANK